MLNDVYTLASSKQIWLKQWEYLIITLSSIERGKERPSLEILVSICNALHVTPDYLLMGNMHSNNIPQNITDGLRLCSENDLDLILAIVQIMVRRSSDRWNSDNYF